MAQYELNLRDYLRIFRKRKSIIFFTFLFVFSLSLFYSLTKKEEKPLYKAVSTVKIEERQTIAGLLAESIIVNPADIMTSEAKFIKSFPVMQRAALQLNMIKEESDEEQINNAISKLQSIVETERIGNTNMIQIIATYHEPKKAMEIANTVAESYIQHNLFEKAKQARQEREFIEEQLLSLEKKLYKSEKELKMFDESVRNIKLAEPTRQKLIELEFKLQELLQQFTEKHPKVIQLREQIKQIESQLKDFSTQELEYARLQREVEVNKSLYGMLKEKLEEARIRESQKVPDISIVNPAIMPDTPINLSKSKDINILISSILGLFLGLVLAFIFETLDTSIGTIDELEKITKLPVLGVVPPILKKEKSERKIFFKKKDFLIPKSEYEDRLIGLFSGYKPKSPQAEAFRNIHTNLKLDNLKKTITITSSVAKEGKTTVACNLALVIAQAGFRTLLVCCDLRKPKLEKIFGILDKPGFSDLLMGLVDLSSSLRNISDIILGDIGFEEALKLPQLDNLWIIPHGELVQNPISLLMNSIKMKNLISKLKEEFDVVIYDVPPILPVADAGLIALNTDMTILVYESGRIGREALKRAKTQLDSAGVKTMGIVLNNTKSQIEPLEIYPYYHRYEKAYYGEEQENDKLLKT